MSDLRSILEEMIASVSHTHWERWMAKNHSHALQQLKDDTATYYPSGMAEMVYMIMHGFPSICPRDKKPLFDSFQKGYKQFCARGCECHRSYLREKQQALTGDQRAIRQERYKKTMLDRHGVDNPSKSTEIKAKRAETNLEKYGVDNPSKSPEILDKIRNTNLERYGVEYSMQSEELIKRYTDAMESKYGCSWPGHSSQIRQRIKDTLLDRYGVEHTFQSDAIRSKSVETNIQRYGVDNPSKSPEIQERIRQTNLQRYGVEHTSMSPEIMDKIKQTNLERYGVEYTFQSEEFKSRSKKTLLDRYGVPVGNSVHLTPESYQNLTDPSWLQQAIQQYTVQDISEQLGCHPTTIYNRLNQFGLKENLGTSRSQAEEVMANYIRSLGIDVVTGDRTIIKPKELDIVIPSRRLAIEYCGIYWHSDRIRSGDYHLEKLRATNAAGYQLITIFEDEWLEHTDAVKNTLAHKLGKSTDKIYARRTTVRRICDQEIIKQFYDMNHVQGWDKGSSMTYALYHLDKPVAMMSFEKWGESRYYLTRYATNISVTGGAGKLLNRFMLDHQHASQIITFADLRWSDGALYRMLGFRLDKTLAPGYQYLYQGRRQHKFNFRKKRLKAKFGDHINIEENTEKEIMESLGIPKIWDCGKLRYVLDLNPKSVVDSPDG